MLNVQYSMFILEEAMHSQEPGQDEHIPRPHVSIDR
jgi:hypothetical protein